MKTLLTHLTRFAAFTAVTLAVLFGLPALAEHHPFILLAVSIAILILAVYAIHKKAYIENEHICPMIRKRRYPIHNNTVC